jgi:hypothetical protein
VFYPETRASTISSICNSARRSALSGTALDTELEAVMQRAVLRAGNALLCASVLTWLLFGPAAAPHAQQAQGRWYKGNTHTHTLNSDGDSTPDEVVR